MSQVQKTNVSFSGRPAAVATCLMLPVLFVSLSACNKANKPSYTEFASPDDASNALIQTAKSGNQNAILAIFGPDSKDIIYSGDAVQDKAAVAAFVTGYEQMHRWRKMPGGAQVLLIGAQNFPFPIPLQQNGAGKWFFDIAAGKEEILSRRIGRNELVVIDICGTLADAQADYYSRRHGDGSAAQYAPKFVSDAGKQNGLYWDSPEGQPKSPLGPLLVYATAEGYKAKPDAHAPFHGYFFKMLTKQGTHAPGGAKDYVVDGKMTGGFAFVAYPAAYGNSGVMTFIINQDGVLLQKDLGKTTPEQATAMNEFDPDAGWKPVRE